MATVKVRCGSCTEIMAVEEEHLGLQVRCPHCQQVVLAPSHPPKENEPSAMTGNRGQDPGSQEEDIFHPGRPTEDALEDFHPQRSPIGGKAPGHSPKSHGNDEPTKAMHSGPSTDATDSGQIPSTKSPHSKTEASETFFPTTKSGMRKAEASPKTNWFIPLVFFPLLIYSILATVIAGILYFRVQTLPPNPFDRMPDLEGDKPGIQREKSRAFLNFDRKFALAPLPEHLLVKVGDSLRVGDLEVTPLQVRRRKIQLLAEGAADRPEPSPYDCLVLDLRLKNLAADYSFAPMDNYFDRNWKDVAGGSPPLTVLVAGKQAFFGGAARWFPLATGNRGSGQRREWLQDRPRADLSGLKPGETMETYIATDGWNLATSAFLFGLDSQGKPAKPPYDGAFTWRVHLRRGLVSHRGREVPATTVIGVEFRSSDIKS